MNKSEMISIVDTCWNAACEAKLGGSPEMFDARFNPPMGCSSIRIQVFFTLLNCIMPKPYTQQSPKEPWQE